MSKVIKQNKFKYLIIISIIINIVYNTSLDIFILCDKYTNLYNSI